jgi:hypothetical protein
VPHYHCRWKQLSVIAGFTYGRYHFWLFNGLIKSRRVAEFLTALQATTAKKFLVIWGRLQTHPLKLEHAHVRAQRHQIVLEYLPAHATDTYPAECIWR